MPPVDTTGPTGRVDPHDGCRKCGGGGSARIVGLRGEPISVATIRRMVCDANIIPVVLGGNGEVLDIGTADRFFTETQHRALTVRDVHHKGWQVRLGAHGHPEYIPPQWVDRQQKVQRP